MRVVFFTIVGILILGTLSSFQESWAESISTSFDQEVYSPLGVAKIQIIDLSGTVHDSIQAKITTSGDPVGFQIDVPEIALDTSIFEIEIPIDSLLVSIGDTITVKELSSGTTDTAEIISSEIILTKMFPFHASFDSSILVVDKFFKIKIEINNEGPSSVSVPIEYVLLEDTGGQLVEKQKQAEIITLASGVNSKIFPQENSLIVDDTNFCVKVTVDGGDSKTSCPEIIKTRQIRLVFVPISLTSTVQPGYPDCEAVKHLAEFASEYIKATFPVADIGENQFTVVDVSCEEEHSYSYTTFEEDFPRDLMDDLETEMSRFGQPDDSSYDVIVGIWRDGAITNSLCGIMWNGNHHALIVGETCVNHPVAHELGHTLGWALMGQPPPLPGAEQCSGMSFAHICNLESPGYWIDKGCEMGSFLRTQGNTCDSASIPKDFMDKVGEFFKEDVTRWVSGATWEYLAHTLDVNCPLNFGKSISGFCNPDPPLIQIRGVVEEGGSTTLKPWFKFDGRPDLLLDNPGRYSIEYFNSQATKIAETGFESLGYALDETSGPALLNLKILDVEGTSQIIIKDGETVLFDRIFSENTPTITITSPQGNEIYGVGERVSVKWDSFDADGDSLIFSIYLSKDDGKTWTPLSSGLSQNHFEFVLPDNRLGSNLLIKVIATDGINTGEDISDSSFIVDETPSLSEGLHVSAANLQFDKIFAGPQIIEVIVFDVDKATTDEPHGEPDVTVNGDDLRMVQSSSGYWHGFFADRQQSLIADSTTSVDGIGLDFGEFCGFNSGNFLSGDPDNYNIDIADTSGIAIPDPSDATNEVQGANPPQNLNNNCGRADNDSAFNNQMNVLSKPRWINELMPGTGEAVGQIGIDKDFWPFVQLYDFSPTGQVNVVWNDGGVIDSETLTFDTIGDYVEFDLDSFAFPRDAQVHLEITDPQLNIDPTAPDSWSFDTSGSSTLYRVFDEFGNPNGDGTAAGLFDIQPHLDDMMFENNGILLVNPDSVPVGTNVLLIQDNGNDVILCPDKQDLLNCFTAGGTLAAGTQPVTIVETGPSTGIFRSFDNSLISSLKITHDAVRGSAAVVDYNEDSRTVLVDFENADLQIHPIDNTWNSGEEISLTLTDFDANKNTRIIEGPRNDPDLGPVTAIKTGSPFSLASSSDISVSLIGPALFSSFSAQGNLAVVEDTSDKQDLLVFEGDVPSSWGGVVFDFGNSVTYEDLLDSINNPINMSAGGTIFHGENIFNFDVRSTCKQDLLGQCPSQLNFYILANNDGSPIIEGSGNISANQVIFLTESINLKGLNLLSSNQPGDFPTAQSLHISLFNGLILDGARFGLAVCVGEITESGCQGIPTNNQNVKFTTIADFFSFGFNNDGTQAGDRIANQIIRLELKEDAINSDNFTGSLEPLVLNQLNVLDENTYKNLNPIDDEAIFIVFDIMTDEDAPRIIYLDLNSVGTIVQLSAVEDVPAHTGVLQIDEFSYKIGDVVQVSVIDPDLSVDSDLINIYTVVPPNETSSEDPAAETIGKAGFPEFGFGPLGTVLSVEFVGDGKWASSLADIDGVPGPDCTPITGNDGLSSTGFTLIETGAGSGIFQGDFIIPNVYCSRAEDGIKELFDGAEIRVVYTDFRDASGEIVTKSASANIESIEEVEKIIASDGTQSDEFGRQTGMYGDTIVVGVPFDDAEGFGAGSAYVYSRNQGGLGNWGQVKKLLPTDGSLEGGLFGGSVAIFDNTIAVGEPTDNEVTAASGAVHVFSKNQEGSNNWGLVKKLLPTNNLDPFQSFGQRVSIWEDTMMVSAVNDDDGFGQGTVYVFSRNQGGEDNWGIVKKILSISGGDDSFGKELSLHGDTVAVASNRIIGLEFFPESVYVFSKDQGGSDNWGLVQTLHSQDQDTIDRFSSSVSLWGDVVVVGADNADTPAGNTGAAYVFSRNEGGIDNWGEVKKITASDGGIASDKKDEFGDSLSLLGDKLVIGAPHSPNFPAEDFTGAAYLYSQNNGGDNNWGEVKKLEASDILNDLGFRFGDSVSFTGGGLVVGASIDDFFQAEGAAYVFEYGFHSDSDGIPDAGDNCPQIDNINQNDLDGDFQGNPCDAYSLITKDTVVSEDQTSIGDVFVTSGKVLTIEDGITLTVMGPIGLGIQSQPSGGVMIKSGGTLKIIKQILPTSANVMIPGGTSVPGCENTNSCYIPFNSNIAINGQVTWTNDDSGAHTVTSGNPGDGPDGFFDSILILAGNEFVVNFDGLQPGEYEYYCQLHPWQTGLVTVG